MARAQASDGIHCGTIRGASAADVGALVRLVNRAYAVERAFIDADRTDAAELRRLVDREAMLVLDEGGELTCCVHLAVDGRHGYLGLLSVDPDRQGAGRGRRLVAAVEERCRAAGCALLELWVVNLRAELPRFYRALGYADAGTRPFEDARLKQPAHFVVMRKPLT